MGQCFLYGNGGGARSYKVTGSVSAPENPKPGDIWVETDTPVSIASIVSEQVPVPTCDVVEGYVHITAGTVWNEGTFVNFDRRQGYSLFLYPATCVQGISGKWVRKNAYVYNDTGTWVQFSSTWNGELFDNGNQYEGVTGGWVGNGISSTTVGTNLSLIVANSSPYLTTQNAIDLSGYTKLHMIADGNAGQYSYFGISSNVPSNARPNYIASATFSGGENVLDISAINSGHISIGATASWGVTINISKVWLT